MGKCTNTWKLNNVFLNNQWDKGEITGRVGNTGDK